MKIKTLMAAIGLFAAVSSANAEKLLTLPEIYVNKDVTTHIIMPENIKMVDLSTERIVGDQCADNMLRLKPLTDSIEYAEEQLMGVVTLIGERHMAQYNLIYTENPMRSNTLYKVQYATTDNYTNPDIQMTEGEMANFAWAISNTDRKFHTVRSKAFGISAQIYNIYSIGSYFFIDLVLENKTKIQYDIDQMRITLADKKKTKATNSQMLELTPAFVLNKEKSFKKNYRQVIVLPKLTYPEEKVLTIEITEDQISGRVISIPIQYEDILHADCFNGNKEEAWKLTQTVNTGLNRKINDLNKTIEEKEKEIAGIQKLLDKANVEIHSLEGKLKKKSNQFIKIQKKVQAMLDTYNEVIKLKDKFPASLAEVLSDDEEDSSNVKFEFLTLGDQ